jgi:acyl-CoA reductase-like NAD-dependent aldehyde dehydrogenase
VGIINQAHYERILGVLEEARQRGCQVISLNGEEPDPKRRQIPMYLIVDPPEDLRCMQDEIFGPVTPVKTYRTIDEAIEKINSGPSPLAAYIVTRDNALAAHFAREVRSGGTGVNTFGVQAANPALPFGGIGASGMGCHSGREGFLTYTHTKPVFYFAEDDNFALATKPPFGDIAKAIADGAFVPFD